MSAIYTTQLRTIINSYSLSHKFISIDERIKIARPYIFNFNYSFDTKVITKEEIEIDILKHFYMREIGVETVPLFLLNLEEYMHRRMPYWAKMFNTVPFENMENPTYNTDVHDEYTRIINRDSTSSAESQNVFEDTPSNHLSDNLDYATNRTIDKGESKGNEENTETYQYHRYGNIGIQTLAQVLQGTREAFITVEDMLFEDMEELFMQVF